MKNTTAVVAIMAVFTLAVCFIFLGSISTELMARLGIAAAIAGLLLLIELLDDYMARALAHRHKAGNME